MTRIRTLLEVVRFEHSIFALPFAYLGMVLAARGLPTLGQFIWITVAMVAARTFAFGINRLADWRFDAANPRTRNRSLPSGAITPGSVISVTIIALAVFAFSAWQLNRFVLALLPGAVFLLAFYSYTKRFTWLSHLVLGITDGMAAPGAWAAVTGSLSHPAPWLLWLTVMFWMVGLDLIYACQDTEFDRRAGLHSVPARFGNETALRWARVSHALTVVCLAATGVTLNLGWFFWVGLVAVAILLWWENSLVKPNDLSRVNLAFFNANGYVSILAFLAAWGGLYL